MTFDDDAAKFDEALERAIEALKRMRPGWELSPADSSACPVHGPKVKAQQEGKS